MLFFSVFSTPTTPTKPTHEEEVCEKRRDGADFMEVDDQDRLTDSDSGIDDCVQLQEEQPTPKKIPQVVIMNRPTTRKSILVNRQSGVSKPQQARKRVRYSDPGPIHRVSAETVHEKIARRKRRQTLPATLNDDNRTQQETTVVRFYPLSAKLSARTIRKLKRSNLSAEMNMIEEAEREQKRKDKELDTLRHEIEELRYKENETKKLVSLGRMNNVADAQRIEELQMEVDRLRTSMTSSGTTVFGSDDAGMAGYNYESDDTEPVIYDDYDAASNNDDDNDEEEGDRTVMAVSYAKVVPQSNREEGDEGVSLSQDPYFASSQVRSDEEREMRFQAESKLEKLEQDFASLQKEYEEACGRISTMEVKISTQAQDLETIAANSRESDKDMQIIQKQATIDDLNERLEASVVAQARRSDALRRLEAQGEELARIIGKLEDSHQQLSSEKEQLGKLLCDEQERNKSLVENLGIQDAQLAELRHHAAEKESEVEAIRTQLEEAHRAQQSQGESFVATISSIEERLADAVQARYDVERILNEKIKEKKATIKSLREQLLLTERECRETKEVLQGTQVELEVTQRASQQLQEQLASKIKSEARLKRGIEKQMRRFSEGMYGLMQGQTKRRSDSGVGISEADELA